MSEEMRLCSSWPASDAIGGRLAFVVMAPRLFENFSGTTAIIPCLILTLPKKL